MTEKQRAALEGRIQQHCKALYDAMKSYPGNGLGMLHIHLDQDTGFISYNTSPDGHDPIHGLKFEGKEGLDAWQ